MSFVEKFNQSVGSLVYLVKGKDKGFEAWHYVLIRSKAILPLFLKKVESGTVDVSEYGKILYSGWGHTPPEDIVQKVKKEYN